uniref:Cytochrome P450 n=1 Tax=Heterorhabditis bacteriophora TaxID=37862 RepID=A0A1I7X4Y8_HETBA
MAFEVYTSFIDDTHEDLPADMARRPEVPFWTGQDEARHANQVRISNIFILIFSYIFKFVNIHGLFVSEYELTPF